MSSLTRGPLPARVYWRRRVLLLLLLLVLVVVALRALGGGGDDPGTASTVAEDTTAASPAPSTGPPSETEDPADTAAEDAAQALAQAELDADREARAAAAAPLPQPEGRCSDADVVVTPVVEGAVAGNDVPVLLNLRTVATEACTWTSGPAHLSVKIISGDDDVWSSQQCPGRLDRSTFTVRADSTTTTSLTWNARRSAEDCPRTTPYAEPGYYHVIASSLGGEPNDVQFELVDPRAWIAEQARVERAEAREQRAEEREAAEQRAEERDRDRQGVDRAMDDGQ